MPMAHFHSLSWLLFTNTSAFMYENSGNVVTQCVCYAYWLGIMGKINVSVCKGYAFGSAIRMYIIIFLLTVALLFSFPAASLGKNN